MNEIIGRKKEQAALQKILDADEPAFLVVYGRRRIGKTYLIKNFFKTKGIFFHLTGIQEACAEVQLQNFAHEFSDVFRKGKTIERPKSWIFAFRMLKKEIEELPKDTKIILFFDELPWLASARSGFLPALEHLWNRYLSEMPHIILIGCGSAASWMMENVIYQKGGLHGRVTKEMRLLPFTLGETEEFLKKKSIVLDRKQVLELYMCLGGVAKYLSYLERDKSVAQLIGELCFSYNAPLISEFHKLYRSLFQHHEEHVEIVAALASSSLGLSYEELAKKLKISPGGTFSKRLEELKQSGFIVEVPLFGQKSHGRYLLIDEYSLFYLTWNAGVSALDLQNRGSDYWLKQQNTQGWKSWTGHAYECLCLKHIEGIKTALGLGAVQTHAFKWRYHPKETKEGGAEIDLVIDRADGCINLCEMKFYQEEFVMSKEQAHLLQRKKECFARVTETRKALFTTLITTHGATHNAHFLSAVDQEVGMDALFLV